MTRIKSQKNFRISSKNGMAFLAKYQYGRIDIVDESSNTTLVTNCTMLPNGKDSAEEQKAAVADIADKEIETLVGYKTEGWTTDDVINYGDAPVFSDRNLCFIRLKPIYDGIIDIDFDDTFFILIQNSKENILAHDLIEKISKESLRNAYYKRRKEIKEDAEIIHLRSFD